ncbi:hypothetical protein LguiB_013183 [Lonicera macranthoides]
MNFLVPGVRERRVKKQIYSEGSFWTLAIVTIASIAATAASIVLTCGSYEKAFHDHKKSLDEKTVQRWMNALRIVAELKGLELKKETNGHMVQIEDDNKLRMHDHLRDLGRQIVREENMTEQGARSRLWSREDALVLFESHMVVALNLNIRQDSEDCSQRFVREDFAQLRNLRFLKLGRADLDGDFKQHLSKLRWLKWECPGNYWPTNCHLKNLVILNLSWSKVTDNWKGWSEIEKAKGLKVLILTKCHGLRRAPIFSQFSTLERLSLRGCENLEEIDPSIQDLTNLRVLDMSACYNLRTFDCSAFSALETLKFGECTELCTLDGLEQLESLRYLHLSGCEILEILLDLSKCKKLEKLVMIWCLELTQIQDLDRLESLQLLNMTACEFVERLPGLSNLKMLKELHLGSCKKLLEVDGLEIFEHVEEVT